MCSWKQCPSHVQLRTESVLLTKVLCYQWLGFGKEVMLCLVLDRIEMLWGRCWGAGEQFPKNKENKEDASCSGIFCFQRSIWTIIRDGKLNVWSQKETTDLLRCNQSISLFHGSSNKSMDERWWQHGCSFLFSQTDSWEQMNS